jgi:hypothetical protein
VDRLVPASEPFKRVTDDETAIVYWPKFHKFAIAVLDGRPSAIAITHDPFSGEVLPPPLRKKWFDTVEKLWGCHYAGSDETPVPDEFSSQVWWIARGL